MPSVDEQANWLKGGSGSSFFITENCFYSISVVPLLLNHIIGVNVSQMEHATVLKLLSRLERFERCEPQGFWQTDADDHLMMILNDDLLMV